MGLMAAGRKQPASQPWTGNSELHPPWTGSPLTLITAADADRRGLEMRNWPQGCTEAVHSGLFPCRLTGSWSYSTGPDDSIGGEEPDWAVRLLIHFGQNTG